MFVLIGFGLFLITVSSVLLKSFGQLDKEDVECKKKIHNGYLIAFGLLGTGIGLVLFSGISRLILASGKRKPHFTARVLMIVVLCFILTDSILRLQVIKKCDLDNEKKRKTKKNGVGFGVSLFFILVIIGTFFKF